MYERQTGRKALPAKLRTQPSLDHCVLGIKCNSTQGMPENGSGCLVMSWQVTLAEPAIRHDLMQQLLHRLANAAVQLLMLQVEDFLISVHTVWHALVDVSSA